MIKIMADSTCDLSDDILLKYDISLAPLSITINEVEYSDRVDIFPDDFYKLLGTLDELPTTAMPSPAHFVEIFEEGLKKGYKEFLCVCMSSGTSGSYQSAMIAKDYIANNFPDTDYKFHVVDSRSMSHGSGYLLLKSAILRDQGATFEELVDFNETYKTNVKHFLSVDDLDNLIKSGRLTNVSAMIGKVLKVKPIMSMRNGKGAIVAKVRGAKKVFSHYVSEFIERVDRNMTDFVIIGYTSDKTKADILAERLRKDAEYEGDIYIMQMGVSVGTHVGLGGLSMFFIEKGHRHDGLIYNEMHQLMKKKDDVQAFIERLARRN